MLSQIQSLTASLPSDLAADANQRAVFTGLTEKLSAAKEPLSEELVQEILGKCQELKKWYSAQSTVHIRAQMLENLVTHLSLEAELQTLLHKSDVTPADVTRIDEIAEAVKNLEKANYK